MLLWSKFWLHFSFQLSKVEVINTNLVKFQVKIPMGRPLIYNVKIRFANKAFVVSGVKPTFLISACVVVLVLRYMGSKLRVIGLGRPVETFHFIEGYPSPPSQGLTCPVTHLLSPRPLLSEASTGNRLLSPSRLRTHMSPNSSFESQALACENIRFSKSGEKRMFSQATRAFVKRASTGNRLLYIWLLSRANCYACSSFVT